MPVGSGDTWSSTQPLRPPNMCQQRNQHTRCQACATCLHGIACTGHHLGQASQVHIRSSACLRCHYPRSGNWADNSHIVSCQWLRGMYPAHMTHSLHAQHRVGICLAHNVCMVPHLDQTSQGCTCSRSHDCFHLVRQSLPHNFHRHQHWLLALENISQPHICHTLANQYSYYTSRLRNPHNCLCLRLACISLCYMPYTRHQRCLYTQHYIDSLCEASCHHARKNSPDSSHTVLSHQNISQLHTNHTLVNHYSYYTSRRHNPHSCPCQLLT